MSQWLRLALLGWEFRPEVLLPVVLAAFLYTRGWVRLRRLGHGRLASRRRLLAYYAGLLVLCIALLSFIDFMGGQLFLMHMVQHMLLTVFVPVLIWFADPFPIMVWALPFKVRRTVVGRLRRGSVVRRLLVAVTRPAVAWMLFITLFLGWHDPNLYSSYLKNG